MFSALVTVVEEAASVMISPPRVANMISIWTKVMGSF